MGLGGLANQSWSDEPITGDAIKAYMIIDKRPVAEVAIVFWLTSARVRIPLSAIYIAMAKALEEMTSRAFFMQNLRSYH